MDRGYLQLEGRIAEDHGCYRPLLEEKQVVGHGHQRLLLEENNMKDVFPPH